MAEVFNPEIINIGHDEYYSIHICDRCRKRLVSAADIFAEDVLKIYGYLKKKGIKTMLWCDKLLNVLTEDGSNFGGALNFVYENWDVNKRLLGIVEPTFTAIEKMPKDLICLNWFWSFGEKYDEDLREFPVIFGNFRGESVTSYRKRCGENTNGGICSNWGATLPTYLQRNMIYFSMAYNDMLFWNYEYSAENNSEYEACVGKCFEKLYQYCHGTSFHSGERVIEIIHGTDKESSYHSFVDGEYTSGEKYVKDYFLGDYEVKYSDSSVYKIPVFLGENIGNTELEWYGGMSQSASSSDNPGSRAVRVDCRLCETAGSTLPLRINGKIYYKIAVKDAYPEKHITDIKFVPYKNSGAKVEIYSIEFKDNYSVE